MADGDDELLRFAEGLVRQVRDEAVEICDVLIDGRMKGWQGDRWKQRVTAAEVQDALRELMPDIVDAAIAVLLDKADNAVLPLAWQQSDGSYVPLRELGRSEMLGWWAGGEGGWLDRFARQRWNDDFPPGYPVGSAPA
ncbi:hypothetical protein [Kineosporia sp. R_H_3]|uniref:hypothetical protein n=1 Tax=Kineosporia sp. R_H_3 TaxID=1961848 RepID=UPI000B4C169D|nr:hypothetical protein [Kineosporia sp. R_H_3]